MNTTTIPNPSLDNSQRFTNNSFPGIDRGIFSWTVDDVISSSIRGSSPLLAWLPSAPRNTWNEKVAHLTAVFGLDFDGSQEYIDYIASASNPDECDFGEGGMDFQVYEYSIGYNRMSTKSKPLNRFDFGGMKQWEKQPVYSIRGPQEGTQITNDAEWALTMLARDMEDHINWCGIYGDGDVPSTKGMFHGLNSVISKGYVEARAEGKGDASIFSDPDVYSGVNLTTPEALISFLRNVIRRLVRRMRQRGYTPQGDDMVIAMPPEIWEECAEVLAAGYFDNRVVTNIEFHTTPEVFARMKQSYMNGGIGQGFLPVSNVGNVPILQDEHLGSSVTSLSGNNAITGDIYVLTKRFGNMNILEMQYINWSDISLPPVGNSDNGRYLDSAYQNGMFRGSWNHVNNMCYTYGMETYMRLVSRVQPFQAKITDVTIEVDRIGKMEAASWTHRNFFPFSQAGKTGGQGESLIDGILSEN